MDVLIYKTALVVEKCPDWLTLNDAVELRMSEGGKVVAHVLTKKGWFLLLGKKRRWVRIGVLSEHAVSLLRPAFADRSHLRVRIVELITSKLSGDKKARISVSVWGDAKALVTNSAEPFSDQHPA